MAAAVLPEEVLAAVLALLTPPELAFAACVCRPWRAAAADSALWRDAYTRAFGHEGTAQVTRRAAAGAPDWRAAVADRYRAGAAWRDGRCRSRTLEAANRQAELFRVVDDHLICCNADGACLRVRVGAQSRA